MGAANTKLDHATDSSIANQIRSLVLMPRCIDCSTLCEPTKNESGTYVQGRARRTGSGMQRKNESKVLDKTQHEENQSSALSTSQTAHMIQSSPILQRSHSASFETMLQRPMIRSSLSFKEQLPPEWSRSQQERLEWAVEEISRRSKIRPPGPRAMQAAMAARSRGKREAASAYNLRYSVGAPGDRTNTLHLWANNQQFELDSLGYLFIWSGISWHEQSNFLLSRVIGII